MARVCHYCFKAEGRHDVTMRKCAGCAHANYCSRECQKAHWSTHKPDCLARRTVPAEIIALVTPLEAYAKAHRHPLFTAITQAFYLHRDLARCERLFMRIALNRVPGATKADSLFSCADASLLSMRHPRWSKIEEEYASLKASFSRSEGVGGVGFFVILFVDQSTDTEFLDPVSFDQDAVDYLRDGWLWRYQLFGRLNRVPDKAPDAGRHADDMKGNIDLTGYSFSTPHFVEQVLAPVACRECGDLASHVSTPFITCPTCNHAHYCTAPCALLGIWRHSMICAPMDPLPEADRQSSVDMARFASSGYNADLFEAAAFNAYQTTLGPAKSETHLLVIQLRRRQSRHPEHNFVVERAEMVPYRLIPDGEALRIAYLYHNDWSKELRTDMLDIVGKHQWTYSALAILFVDADSKAYFMHSAPFWPRTVEWASTWPFDYRHFLNDRINGSRQDERLARATSTCPCNRCVRARRTT